eukprot:TRINITY_DN38661_c0_g1_i1.p1 TRINITY_DN38661_c0_g1~~TRINITY_DN38661_c0_g1_i1.p1  ORF type:complete len:121 (+),score=2.32 TRINITY_DN38661_c0_g1_i1:47-409(+)
MALSNTWSSSKGKNADEDTYCAGGRRLHRNSMLDAIERGAELPSRAGSNPVHKLTARRFRFHFRRVLDHRHLQPRLYRPRATGTSLPRLEPRLQYLHRAPKIGRAVQQECRDRSRMPSSA